MATVSTVISNGTYTLTYSITSTATTTTINFTGPVSYSRSTGLKNAYDIFVWVEAQTRTGLISDFAHELVSGRLGKGTTSKSFTISGNKSFSWNRGASASSKYVAFYVEMSRVSDNEPFASTKEFAVTVPALPIYTNTYKANGGSGSDQTQTHQHGVTFQAKPASTFSRTNYVFKNWNTAANGGGTSYSAGGSYSYNANLILYAQWYAPYTVSYNANGGSGAPGNQTKVYNQALTLQTATPTRTNYVFKDWTTAANGTGSHYSPGGSYTANANLILYAQWYAPYTVSYDANGGSGKPGDQTKIYNQTLTLSATVPTRENYTFANWNTTSNGNGTPYSSGGSYTANANAILYAQWTQHYASPQVSINEVYRCNQQGFSEDEGSYAAFECTFKIWNTSAQNSCSISANIGNYSVSASNFVASNTSGSGWSTFTTKLVLNAYLDTDTSYIGTVTVTDTQGGGNTNISGRSTRSTSTNTAINNAFYMIDVLGDKYLYNLSTDTTVNSGKTYYTRSGAGNISSPYVYTEATPASGANPNSLGYYEASGPRPAHGIAFGMPAKEEGFHVNMPITLHNATLGNGAASSCFIVQDPENFPSSQETSNVNVYGDLLAMRQNNYDRVHVRAVAITSGLQGMELETIRTNSSNNIVNHGVQLLIDGAGNRTVILNDPAAWRIGMGAMGASNYNGYWGLAFPNGSTNDWVRTPQSGLLPYASGGNSSSLGSSVWPFTNVYAQNIYWNGQNIAANRVLWSGAHYMFNNTQQDANLSQNVTDQPNGIVLCWSAYSSSGAQNYDWNYTFVPKSHVERHSTTGVTAVLATASFGAVGTKYVYVSNNKITGNDKNDDTGTANGITYKNNYWVLRYVIGV